MGEKNGRSHSINPQASIALWKSRLFILERDKLGITTRNQKMGVLGLALRAFCTLDIGPKLF